MTMRIFMLFALWVFSSLAGASTLCTSKITRELETCARSNFEVSDRQLNSAYKMLASRLQGGDAQTLLKAQRAWLAYEEKTCQGAYDVTSPGEESGIDKWTCLDGITKNRTRELQYLESGTGLDDFFHAVDVVAKYYESGDRGRFIDKLAARALVDDEQDWNSYVTENCKLAASRLSEEKKDCMARQTFYRY